MSAIYNRVAARVLFRFGWWRGLGFSSFSLRVVTGFARERNASELHIPMRIDMSDKRTEGPNRRVEIA